LSRLCAPIAWCRTSAGPSKRRSERAPNYQLVAAWSGFLLLLGAGAFALGMALHNEALAEQRHAQHMESIYYCATGEETPLFEPRRDRKDQRDI
jgi:hypothetical protein